MRKYEVFTVNDFMVKETISTVREEDYLKVVEEKKILEKKENDIIEQISELTRFISNGNKYNKGKVGMRTSDAVIEIIKEKDEEIEKLKEENEYLVNSIKSRKEVIDFLNSLFGKNESTEKICEEPIYEEWCELIYVYKDNLGNEKTVGQNMNFEDACELIGMDSDNWISFTVNKYRKEVK